MGTGRTGRGWEGLGGIVGGMGRDWGRLGGVGREMLWGLRGLSHTWHLSGALSPCSDTCHSFAAGVSGRSGKGCVLPLHAARAVPATRRRHASCESPPGVVLYGLVRPPGPPEWSHNPKQDCFLPNPPPHFQAVSIVFFTDSWRPDSFYDKILANRK